MSNVVVVVSEVAIGAILSTSFVDWKPAQYQHLVARLEWVEVGYLEYELTNEIG
jgi:hypothetical protein